ncbi:unnamed protein product [Vicia faba]|uniref:Uncharacterized protein n=1 Tax=Vicia faba TaxID=3906 RepID=A0AAV0YX42_VICFA|nr:unnamed protein product [Vicia faba]
MKRGREEDRSFKFTYLYLHLRHQRDREIVFREVSRKFVNARSSERALAAIVFFFETMRIDIGRGFAIVLERDEKFWEDDEANGSDWNSALVTQTLKGLWEVGRRVSVRALLSQEQEKEFFFSKLFSNKQKKSFITDWVISIFFFVFASYNLFSSRTSFSHYRLRRSEPNKVSTLWRLHMFVLR